MTKSVKGTRVPKGVFGGRDLPHLKGWSLDLEAKWGRDSGLKIFTGCRKKVIHWDYGMEGKC